MAVRDLAWLPLTALLCSCAAPAQREPLALGLMDVEIMRHLDMQPSGLAAAGLPPQFPARPALARKPQPGDGRMLQWASGLADQSEPNIPKQFHLAPGWTQAAVGDAHAADANAALAPPAAARLRAAGPANAEPVAQISRSGSAAYHIPPRMKLNQASQVELWIDLSGPAEQLRAELSNKLKLGLDRIGVRIKPGAGDGSDPPGVVGKQDIWVGQHMRASLRGDGFKIEPEGERGKSLAAEGRARWNWSVTPLRDPGDGKLLLLLEASIDRGVDQDAFPSIQEYVEVELAPWWQRIPDLLAKANALLALFGLGLGAVIVYAVKWLRKHWRGGTPFPRLRI